jgi:hypothetical protein
LGEISIAIAGRPPAWYVRTENWKLVGWDTLPPMLFKTPGFLSRIKRNLFLIANERVK